jgi:hypothetical protein
MKYFISLLTAVCVMSSLFAQSRSGGVVITYPTSSSTVFNNVTVITNATTISTTNLYATTIYATTITNVANTFTTNLTVNNTSVFNGKVTLVQGVEQYQGVLTHAGTVTLDFDQSQLTTRSIVLTGALTLAYSNLATNRSYDLLIKQAQATNCTLSIPSGTQGYYTTTLSNGWHRLKFESWGSVASNVWLSGSSYGTY